MDARDTQILREFRSRTGKYISRIEEALMKELGQYSKSSLCKPLLYAIEGGKRIRPLILILSSEVVGSYKSEGPLSAAVAVELLHTESIIHDDILDLTATRRDKAAFHVRYGYGASMLTADFVFGMILDIASRYRDARVAKELSSAALQMCEGEFDELKIDPSMYRLSWDEYIRLIMQKTASLFRTSAKLGGIIGGGSDEEVAALSEYGLQIGTAYQIRDDIIDWGEQGKVTQSLVLNPRNDVLSHLKEKSEYHAEMARKSLSSMKQSSAKTHLERLTHLTSPS